MRVSIVNDALSTDLHTALELLQEAPQVREMELRRLGFDALPNVDPRWLEAAEKAVHARRLRVTAMSLSMGANWSADAALLLPLAARLQCPLLSITLPADESDADFDALREFCARAADSKVGIALRNDAETSAGTAADALDLLEEIAAPELGLDWDPAAAMAAGDGTGLGELERIAPHLRLLHVRDAVRRGLGAEWASLGKGVIPWEDILEQLYALKYRGPVVLDHGLPNRIRESRASLPLLARWTDACRFKRGGEDGDSRNDREGDGAQDRPAYRSGPRGPKRR
jgi:sugar phosphate isomerase/epimerase